MKTFSPPNRPLSRACRRTQVARPWPRRTPPCRRRPEARSTIVLERRRRCCARLQDEPALAAGPLRVEWEAVASRRSAPRRAPQERPRPAADLLQCSASAMRAKARPPPVGVAEEVGAESLRTRVLSGGRSGGHGVGENLGARGFVGLRGAPAV